MKITAAVSTLISIVTLTSCAPIAASSPKLAQQRRGDSGVIHTGAGESKTAQTRIVRALIVSAEKYDAYEKTLRDYKLEKIHENDEQLFELREKHSIKKLEFKGDLNRMELVAIFILDMPEEDLSLEKNTVKVKWIRNENDLNSFSLSIDEDATSEDTWALIKKNISGVTIAYRAVKTEKK